MEQQQPSYEARAFVVETNGLGIAGFICSLVGLLVTGGLLSPVGLILSLIALGRRPRGWATAGVVLGAIGSCGLIILAVLIVTVGIAALAGMAGILLLTESDRIDVSRDMAAMAVMVDSYRRENRYLPATLDDIGVGVSTRTDPWGTRYAYHLRDDDQGFDFVSAGPDSRFGTPDDIAFSRLDELWEDFGEGASISVSGSDDGRRVYIELGDRVIELTGDEDGGQIQIDTGGQIIEIVGDEDGGTVEVIRSDPAASENEAPSSEASESDGG